MSKRVVVTLFQGDYKNIKQHDSFSSIHVFEGAAEATDGYHTFEELYNHRITLFIALCKMLDDYYSLAFDTIGADLHPGRIWRSKVNGDGTTWDGWFIMGINQEEGKQITYHLPLDRWEETEFAATLDQAPAFDGHTSEDVINRLKDIYTPISQAEKDQAKL